MGEFEEQVFGEFSSRMVQTGTHTDAAVTCSGLSNQIKSTGFTRCNQKHNQRNDFNEIIPKYHKKCNNNDESVKVK
ncbi:MAG: hypothetical protein GY820_41065 [Gammaproteobacteria bacterium]|nr:hypothetical protein [Gammaproteobacteria bacterium]